MMALSIVPRNGAEIDEFISDKRANRQPMSVCRAERTSFGAASKFGNDRQHTTLELEGGHQLRGALFVCIPSSEQKSAPRFGALLLDIGQIDGVSFHQKLDCRRNDQEWRNVDREYLKGLHGSSSAISRCYHNLLGRVG